MSSTGTSLFAGYGSTLNITGLAATKTYYVTAVSSAGCEYSTRIPYTVNVRPVPVAAFTNSSTLCQNMPVTFTSTSTIGAGSTIASWSWNFGAGATPATATTAGPHAVTYSSAGPRSVSLSVISNHGCTSSVATQSVSINAQPLVSFLPLSAVCTNVPAFALTGGSPSGGVYSGTGVSGGLFNPATAGAGTHAIAYTYTDPNGCQASVTQNITVHAVTSVSLASFAAVCLNTSSFTLSGGSPSGGTYSGPGVSSGSFDPSVAGVGTHIITYSYTNGNGCIQTASRTITVNPLPVADFTFTEKCLNDGDQTLFTDQSTASSGGSISSWIFNFGDGNTGTYATKPINLKHVYAPVNTYPPSFTTYTNTLTVVSNLGCSVSVAKSVKVYFIPPAPTVLNAPYSVCSGTSATIQVSPMTNVVFKWYATLTSTPEIATGTTFTTPPITATTTYYVASFSNNLQSCTQNRVAVTVNVNAAPAAPALSSNRTNSGNNYYMCASPSGLADITMTVSNYNSSFTYEWRKGTSVVGSGQTYLANSTGTYTVIVTDLNGCKSSRTFNIINPVIVTTYSVSGSTILCPGGSVTFYATVPSSIYSYAWYLDGNLISGATADNYTATVTGTYHFVATNSAGCEAQSASTSVTGITPLFIMSVPSPAMLPSGGGGSVTLSMPVSTSGPSYTSFQWYRNGIAIPGATSFSYVTTLTGVYYMEATGSCGMEKSNEIRVTLDCNNLSFNSLYNASHTFLGTTNLSGPGYTFGGVIEVAAGATLNIMSTNVEIKPCTKIIVRRGGQLNISGSNLYGCDEWAGILVEGNILSPSRTAPAQGRLSITGGSSISNAAVAVRSYQGGFIQIMNASFTNNRTHVAITDYPFAHNSIVNGCFFDGLYTSGTICTGAVAFSNPTFAKMIYLSDVNNIDISFCTLKGYNGSSMPGLLPDQNGVEGNYADFIRLRNNSFQGYHSNAVAFYHSANLSVGLPMPPYASSEFFTGDITTGVYLDNCTQADVRSCSFMSLFPGIFKNGIIAVNTPMSVFDWNIFNNCIHGIQYYIDYTASLQSTIAHNYFNHTTYGTIVSYSSNPLQCPSLNAWATPSSPIIKLDIYCNKYDGNSVGIIGSGNLSDQGSGLGDAANNIFNTNIDWDILWQNPMTPVNYFELGYGVNAGTSGLPHMINCMMQGTSDISVQGALMVNCRGSVFSKKASTGVDVTEKEGINAQVFPNPFNRSVSVKLSRPFDANTTVKLVDILGKEISVSRLAVADNEVEMTPVNISDGIYMIIIEQDGVKIFQEKLVKTNR